MKVETTIKKSWLHYINRDAPKNSNYKLHVALPIGHFDEYNEQLRSLLEGAVRQGIIQGFKVLNRGNSYDLEQHLGGKEVSFAENKRARLYNNPITIYLTETFNPTEIAKLCHQLENYLSHIPLAEAAYLSDADLSLTSHVTFRQETLDGEYIAIAEASPETLNRLKKEGKASIEYHRLREALTPVQWSVATTEQQQEKEDNIKNFYENFYENYKKRLYSEDVYVQFEVTCKLLDIDLALFQKNESPEYFIEIIASKYRLVAQRYDSDKVQSQEIKNICEEILNLIGDAKTILNEIVASKQYRYNPQEQDKEDRIRCFYNSHYEGYRRDLQSNNIDVQFKAACKLLDIDPTVFNENKDEQYLRKRIASKYRIMARHYHTDKVQSPNMKKICEELFNLLGESKTILEEISKNPSVVNKEDLLKQHPYKPQYQYELKIPEFDPYYFKDLAQSSVSVLVIENWKFETKATTCPSETNEGTVTLYVPYLTMHDKDDKRVEKLMPGYEAFYTLFLAGSLPDRFGQGHFYMIFPTTTFENLENLAKLKKLNPKEFQDSKEFQEFKKLFSFGQLWLLSKVLVTPEFISFMDSDDLIYFAKIATLLDRSNIGFNPADIFLYYYEHYPETLSGRRLEKFIAEKDFNKSKVAELILNNPQNLEKVSDSVIAELLELDEGVKQYIFSSPQLRRKLNSYVIDEKFIKPFFGVCLNSLQDMQSIALAYLILWENDSILSAFSNESLKKFKIYIEENSLKLPPYLLKAIQLKVDVFLYNKETAHHAIENEMDIAVLNAIKETFPKNKDIVFSLNKEILLYFSQRLDLELSDYILIVNALYALNEEAAATPLLTKLGQQFDLLAQYPEMKDLRAAINDREESLKKMHAENRKEKINALLNAADEDLENREAIDEIKAELNTLGAQEEIRLISTNQVEMFKREFYSLVRRLREGEYTDALQEAFSNLRFRVNHAGCSWREVSAYGDITEGYTIEKKPASEEAESYLFTENVVPIRYPPLLDYIWQLMKESIGIFSWMGLLRMPLNIPVNSYGIQAEMSLLDKLKRLFFIHECLGSPETFYTDLASLTEENASFSGLQIFDSKLIAQHLLQYAENELAVYIKGVRNAAHGKHHRFIDFNDVKAFYQLWQLYDNLGQQGVIETLLSSAYQQLCNAYDNDTSNLRPIAKYIEIRKYSKLRGPLEDRAAQIALCEILNGMWDSTDYKAPIEYDFFGKRKETPWLSLTFFAIYNKKDTNIDLQAIYTLFADALHTSFWTAISSSSDDSDKMRCNELLRRIHTHPFLRDHFGLNDLSEEELINPSVHKMLETHLRQKVNNAPLAIVSLQAAHSSNALTYSGSSSSEVSDSKALTYSGSSSGEAPNSNALTYVGPSNSKVPDPYPLTHSAPSSSMVSNINDDKDPIKIEDTVTVKENERTEETDILPSSSSFCPIFAMRAFDIVGEHLTDLGNRIDSFEKESAVAYKVACVAGAVTLSLALFTIVVGVTAATVGLPVAVLGIISAAVVTGHIVTANTGLAAGIVGGALGLSVLGGGLLFWHKKHNNCSKGDDFKPDPSSKHSCSIS